MSSRFLRISAVSLLGSVLAVGCSVEQEPDGASSDLSGDAGAGGASNDSGICVDPSTYIASIKNGACDVVPGAGGKWQPAPLFQGAPAQFHACLYAWKSDSGSAVDKAALFAHVNPIKGGSALTASCAAAGSRVDHPGVLASEIDPGVPGGSTGCDVCGYVDGDNAYVVLPPEQVTLGQFSVALSNGTQQGFTVDLHSGVHAATITLPPLPAGVTYVSGPISVR